MVEVRLCFLQGHLHSALIHDALIFLFYFHVNRVLGARQTIATQTELFLVNWFFQGATNQPAIWRIELDAGYVADSVLIRLHIRGELQPKFLVSIRV